ncbi:MAG: small ribosomal subunit Rsm22 family protein, partial [Bdellovibrionota bacterium]
MTQKKPARDYHRPRPGMPFPPSWTWLFDETVPNWVKNKYSPRESWKGKPFEEKDSQFFFKGVGELSELFTEQRPGRLPDYFAHPRFRSGYLLYFLPLQAAKFITVFSLHHQAIEAALKHSQKTGVLRVADLGAGPGTASIALVQYILANYREDMPILEFEWYDSNREVMEDGCSLLETMSESFPKLRGKIRVNPIIKSWQQACKTLKGPYSLIFFGHVLNEAPQAADERLLSQVIEASAGGGILFLEPATKRSAQILASLRQLLIDRELIEPSGRAFWGPCLHAGICPLGEGRDWCHFSVRADIPGHWFKRISKALGSERQWVKFSYLWLSSKDARPSLPDSSL